MLDPAEYPTDITSEEENEIDSMIQKINELTSSSNEEEVDIDASETGSLAGTSIDEDEIPF